MAFAACKRLCVQNTSFAQKQLIAYVYNVCDRGDLCVQCTSFARTRLIAYFVSLLRSRRLIVYAVRFLRLRQLMLQDLSDGSCNDWDRANREVTEGSCRFLRSCDDWDRANRAVT